MRPEGARAFSATAFNNRTGSLVVLRIEDRQKPNASHPCTAIFQEQLSDGTESSIPILRKKDNIFLQNLQKKVFIWEKNTTDKGCRRTLIEFIM